MRGTEWSVELVGCWVGNLSWVTYQYPLPGDLIIREYGCSYAKFYFFSAEIWTIGLFVIIRAIIFANIFQGCSQNRGWQFFHTCSKPQSSRTGSLLLVRCVYMYVLCSTHGQIKVQYCHSLPTHNLADIYQVIWLNVCVLTLGGNSIYIL